MSKGSPLIAVSASELTAECREGAFAKPFPVKNPEISATESVFPNSSRRLFCWYLGFCVAFLAALVRLVGLSFL